MVKNKKYINFNIESKFKSKYADYKNRRGILDGLKNNQGIKYNKTYKFCNIDKFIHFTNIHTNQDFQKRNRALTKDDFNYYE